LSTALAIRHLGFEHLGVWHAALESRAFEIVYLDPAREDLDAVDAGVLRVHAQDRPCEGLGTHVAPDHRADTAGTCRRADDDDAPRFEQRVEVANAH